MRAQATYLMILSTSEGLTYVLRERRMAFPPTRQIRLDIGDQVLLYSARSLFGNPNRDRGRVIGTAEVVSPLTQFDSELQIAGRIYTSGCELKITGLAPLGQGVVLADIVQDLEAFQPNPDTWSVRLRRSLLPLTPRDAGIVYASLKAILCDPGETIGAYLEYSEKRARN
jgi:hypothetical protein